MGPGSMPHVTWQKDQFKELGTFSNREDAASYRYKEFFGCFSEEQYRFLVVHSSKLDGRKARSLEKQLSKRKHTLEKEVKNKVKETYACLPDAEAALKQFIARQADEHFNITGQVVTEAKKTRPRLGFGLCAFNGLAHFWSAGTPCPGSYEA